MGRLLALGTSHTVAPAWLRDGLYLDEAAVQGFLSNLLSHEGFEEAVHLQTCTRAETYAVVRDTDAAEEALIDCLSRGAAAGAADIREHSYGLTGAAAARHLLRVAAGLDSIILGEPQILGQVKQALSLARQSGSTGPVLSHLFRGAIRAGKRTRSDTRLNVGPTSLASAAVRLALSASKRFPSESVLVIGAGATAALAARHVAKRGPGRLVILNRSPGPAERLASELGAEAGPIESLRAAAEEASVIITATSAPGPVVRVEDLAAVMRRRPDRSLVVVDLACPRDVEGLPAAIPNLTLLDLDGLGEQVRENLERQALEIPKAEEIVDAELARFLDWRREREVVPLVRALREQFFATGEREIEAQVRRSGPQRREELELYTRSLLSKLLHSPTKRIKEVDRESDDGLAKLEALRELFALEDSSSAAGELTADRTERT